MAQPPPKPYSRRNRLQDRMSKSLQSQKKQSSGLTRKQLSEPIRKSTRLQEKERLHRRLNGREHPPPLSSPPIINSHIHKTSYDPSALAKPSRSDRKRKHPDQAEYQFSENKNEPQIKRPRTSSAASGSKANSIRHWIQEGSWPKEYFEQDSDMSEKLNKKRSVSSLQKSVTSCAVPRDAKNPAAADRLYEDTLKAAGIFMHNRGKVTPTDACVTLCKTLLNTAQPVPNDTLFQDDRFQATCSRLRNANEAKVIRYISHLIVPSGELLHAFGAEELEHLTDHMDEKWYGCVPIVSPTPQPDFSIGFNELAFSQSQLEKLGLFIQGWKRTPFLATSSIYFPFLTCEVKCGNEALDVADRQNAHNGSVAVKQVVNLYRKVSRENELDRKILAFSVSHDHRNVRMYGHYASINGDTTSFHRYLIDTFDITRQGGRDKWTAYKFVRNVYKTFVPAHLERIRTAINQLPSPNPQFSRQSPSESAPELDDGQSTAAGSQDTGPTTPPSRTARPSFKKPKIKGSSTTSANSGQSKVSST